MKNKKQDKPITVIFVLFVLGILLSGNVASIMVEGEKYPAIMIIASVFMVLFVGFGIYFMVKMLGERGKEADETSIKCMHKAGFYTFVYTICAVVIASAALRLVQAFSGSEESIFGTIGAEVIFAIFCIIVQLSILAYTALYLFFMKKSK